MKTTNITSSKLPDLVKCPTSKSYANRALILAALKESPIHLTHLPQANDVKDMINVLEKVGLQLEKNSHTICVVNSFPECESSEGPLEISLGEGGTTSRFLFPFLALGRREYIVSLENEMANRPMGTLVDLLNNLGARVSQISHGKFSIQGPLAKNEAIAVDCSQTTQFASALLHLKNKINLVVTPTQVDSSQKYIDMTVKLVDEINNVSTYQVPADFSSAGYFIAFSVLNQNVKISNIKFIDSFQADAVLVDELKRIGAEISMTDDGLEVKKCSQFISGLNIDGSTCLDLTPTLMYIASFIPFESQIRNIRNLRFKECDRLTEMQRILKAFNVKFDYNDQEDLLTIFPSQPKVLTKKFHTENDHRMVMVASLFFKTLSGGDISPSESVNKSFPEFFKFF